MKPHYNPIIAKHHKSADFERVAEIAASFELDANCKFIRGQDEQYDYPFRVE